MSVDKTRNAKLLEELRKTLTPEESHEEKTYTFHQYTIDGRTYSTLSDLKGHEIKVATAEERTIESLAQMMSESTEQSIRGFSRTVKNIGWLHQAGGDRLSDTPLYQIAKEFLDKAMSVRPGSVERDLLLMTAVERIKTAYRALVSRHKGGKDA